MDPEAIAFRQLLLAVFDQSRRCFDGPVGKLAVILEQIPHIYQRITDSSVLERNLPGKNEAADFWNARQFLYLRPIAQGCPTIPILTVKCDFSKSHPLVTVKLILFVLDNQDKIQMLGYRFESPHGEGEGRHDFYHVQPIINVIRAKDGPRLNCPDWIPDTHPSLALDAENSVMLVLCLLLSLYGLQYTQELGRRVAGGTLARFFRTAHFGKFPPTFWRVTVGKESVFYKTWLTKSRFRTRCLAEHGMATKCAEISAHTYYSQPFREVA
jgi:hypothetical protein